MTDALSIASDGLLGMGGVMSLLTQGILELVFNIEGIADPITVYTTLSSLEAVLGLLDATASPILVGTSVPDLIMYSSLECIPGFIQVSVSLPGVKVVPSLTGSNDLFGYAYMDPKYPENYQIEHLKNHGFKMLGLRSRKAGNSIWAVYISKSDFLALREDYQNLKIDHSLVLYPVKAGVPLVFEKMVENILNGDIV